MPTQSVDPRIDEERQHEAVESAAHDHAGEEGQDELDPPHRATIELTARTYAVAGTGSRCGSDQRAVMAQGCGRLDAVLVGRLGHALGIRVGSSQDRSWEWTPHR